VKNTQIQIGPLNKIKERKNEEIIQVIKTLAGTLEKQCRMRMIWRKPPTMMKMKHYKNSQTSSQRPKYNKKAQKH